ncbi:MAG: hypothetical protein U5N26_00360 [Candidatus Marinimicrobia bacterium]|nr:hypothetical protein [Candidatus Neomarinimicrobiota bacterium]
MEILSFYEQSQSVLTYLEKDETEPAYSTCKNMLKAFPGSALVWYLLGCYYEKKKDIFHSIDSYTRALHTDPTFLAAAEKLLALNKDNYSVGELKYLYTLILDHKKGSEEMRRFLQKFKKVPMDAELTVPDLGQDQLSANDLPGMDDDAYIRHLIRGMDRIEEKSRSTPAGQGPPEQASGGGEKGTEEKAIPVDFRPPPKQTPAPQNNDTPVKPASYGIETMTMARMYIRQGLYENAIDILLKLQKRDPSSERVKKELERVKQLISEENEDKNE